MIIIQIKTLINKKSTMKIQVFHSICKIWIVIRIIIQSVILITIIASTRAIIVSQIKTIPITTMNKVFTKALIIKINKMKLAINCKS